MCPRSGMEALSAMSENDIILRKPLSALMMLMICVLCQKNYAGGIFPPLYLLYSGTMTFND